eukprot:5704556-Amphidinium_carterae.1
MHHYGPNRFIALYVALAQNPDFQTNNKAKRYRERKTPYPGYHFAARRPFDQDSDERYIVGHVEVKDIPLLPRNLNRCYEELNMYAQTGGFSLAFEQELRNYFDRRFKCHCDLAEYQKLQELHAKIDEPYGSPENLDTPQEVMQQWYVWAHVKTVNEGYYDPVDKMAEMSEDVTTNTFVPIKWNAELVTPPYEDFYEDGVRAAPSQDATLYTGYDHLEPLRPVIYEEYWNRMVREWIS